MSQCETQARLLPRGRVSHAYALSESRQRMSLRSTLVHGHPSSPHTSCWCRTSSRYAGLPAQLTLVPSSTIPPRQAVTLSVTQPGHCPGIQPSGIPWTRFSTSTAWTLVPLHAPSAGPLDSVDPSAPMGIIVVSLALLTFFIVLTHYYVH